MSAVLAWGPRDYVQTPEIPADWKVVDVGPGEFPFMRANVFIDRDPKVVAPLSDQGKATLVCDINKGFPGIDDKAFDYAFTSHIFEHLNDVRVGAQAISRIAKSGTLVVPSAYKEALFNFEERTHLWDVLPNPTSGDAPIFVRRNRDFIQPLEDELASQALCFLMRTGSNHDCTAEIHLRQWFQLKEKNLDIVFHWKDDLKLIVIG
jgi:hypothetical protein